MKAKVLKLVLILAAASFCSFAEIVSWKGMEMGLAQNPKWLKAWRSKGDERALRNKFDVEKTKSVVVGFGQADSLEGARTNAQLDADRQLAQSKTAASGEAANAARLEYLGEYWEEDDQKGYSLWSVYEL